MKHGSPYGIHRVLEPQGVLPQGAWKLDNRMEIWDNEILIQVSALNIDAASFTQIKTQAEGDLAKIEVAVRSIVAQRGKHHNPVTGSGGMLIGTVLQIGPALQARNESLPVIASNPPVIANEVKQSMQPLPVIANEVKQSMTCGLHGLPRCARSDESTAHGPFAASATQQETRSNLQVGDKIATLVSLSLTPLRIDAIRAIHLERDQIEIEGQAILFETGLYAKLPTDIAENLALAVLDVAGAAAQTARLVKPGNSVVVIGAGGKSGTLCVYQARKSAGPSGCVIGVSPFEKDCQRMRDLGWVNHVLQVDARNALALMEAVSAVTQGQLADVVINCVNVQDTEMGSILATREGGRIYFFSIATSFTAAALGAEGVGKDVEMIVGNGYAKGHAELSLDLLRESPRLRQLFEELYV